MTKSITEENFIYNCVDKKISKISCTVRFEKNYKNIENLDILKLNIEYISWYMHCTHYIDPIVYITYIVR